MRCNNPEMEEKVACYNLLSDPEKAIVVAHVQQCPSCALDRSLDHEINLALGKKAKEHLASLEGKHLPSSAITDYALQKKKIHRGKLQEIEAHLNLCPACQREVWLVQDTEKDFVERKRPDVSYLRRLISSPALSVVMAGIVLIILPYLAFKVTRLNRELKEISALHQSKSSEMQRQAQEERKAYEDRIALLKQELSDLSKPQPGAFVLISAQDIVRSSQRGKPAAAPKEIRFRPNVKWFSLIIWVRSGTPYIYKVQIYKADRKIWEDDVQSVIEKDKPYATISIMLNKESFEEGPHTLRVYEKNKQGNLLVSYPLLIIKK